ncbi:hypothetical protein SLA2020_248800 [Shorea laevis]
MLEFLFNSFLEHKPGSLHQLRTQTEHQNAKLNLTKRAVPDKIPFFQHATEVIIGQIMQPQKSRVPPWTLKSDDPLLGVNQQVKPIAQLSDQAVTANLPAMRGKKSWKFCNGF